MPWDKPSKNFSIISIFREIVLSPLLIFFFNDSLPFSKVSMSEKINSVSIISISSMGSTLLFT